eukprot:GFKZ01013143.1.p1 GENE.GFKZ01013143.1~~GFKZ01013143.1.p1  ORF type:complete len:1284 (+),score=239.77 GFKZ01013143.1:287-3853(+)
MASTAFCATALSARTFSNLRSISRFPYRLHPFRVRPSPNVTSIPLRLCATVRPPASEPHNSAAILPSTTDDPIDILRHNFASLPGTEQSAVEDLISSNFPFALDEFQTAALRALNQGQSVVLSAPTGAGKTIVGEMAVYFALCRRRRVFYTTPLKALSNQKFYDFKKLFGDHRVGLLTGDVTVNRDADVIVMTTEVYRNMLYAESVEGDRTVSNSLFAVVFDEFHYLNDRDRGTVWEESVINSPSNVLLVALSATMSNTNDVRDWFCRVQGPTALVRSEVRPVPLKFAYCDQEGMTPLFAKEESNPRSHQSKKGFGRRRKKSSAQSAEVERKLHPKLLRRLKESTIDRTRGSKRGKGLRSWDDDEDGDLQVMKDKYRKITERSMRRGKDRFAEIPSFQFVVRKLRRNDMLPCIVFIFSRAGCDRAALSASTERENLVTEEEREQIKERLDVFVEAHPNLVQPERLELAMQGIASHHAGLLPLWKMCVEELFQDGLIKVVFATETLAAGINMPARTTVISALSKRAGEEGFVDLTTSEVLQMAGRAGRRGKDVVGHSVLLRSKKEGALEAFKVVTADVDALQSKFSPNYGMVLNLLSARPLNEAKKLVDRSFGNFLRQKAIREANESAKGAANDDESETIAREKAALEYVLEESRKILESVDEKNLRSYVKHLERVKAEKRALAYLVQQSTETDSELIEETLTFAPSGTRLLLRQRDARESTGAERREQRRNYKAAISAAGNGDLGMELREFYLGATDWEVDDIDKDEEEEEDKVLEAVLVDMHNDSTGVWAMFAAVDANGDLRIFNHTAVSRIFFDMEAIAIEEIAEEWGEVHLPGRTEWRPLGGDEYVADLPAELQGVVEKVEEWRSIRKREREGQKKDVEAKGGEGNIGHPEVTAQRERVRFAKRKVREHELHGRDDVGVLLAAKRAIVNIERTLSGETDAFGAKRRQGKKGSLRNRYAGVKGKDGKDGAAVKVRMSNGSWDEFMALANVLQHYGFLDEEYNVTSVGSLGAKVRSENELWSSLVLMHGELERVSPGKLGAVLAATLLEGGRSDVYMEYEASEETMEMLGVLEAERARLMGVQGEWGVEVTVGLDAELVGLVERWASGVSWLELLSGTSLQEGDACRLLRRVLDLLRQVRHLPVVTEEVKRNARRAVALLDRFPVTDERTYVVRETERLAESPAGGV